MKESEKTLERALKNLVENQMKGWCLKLLALHITGLPDRICLFPPGRLFFVEVKTTGEKPKAIQLWVHTKLRNLGFDVWVVDNSETLKEIKKHYAQ